MKIFTIKIKFRTFINVLILCVKDFDEKKKRNMGKKLFPIKVPFANIEMVPSIN